MPDQYNPPYGFTGDHIRGIECSFAQLKRAMDAMRRWSAEALCSQPVVRCPICERRTFVREYRVEAGTKYRVVCDPSCPLDYELAAFWCNERKELITRFGDRFLQDDPANGK